MVGWDVGVDMILHMDKVNVLADSTGAERAGHLFTPQPQARAYNAENCYMI